MRTVDRIKDESVRPSNGAAPYLVVMARHQEALRRDMVARIEKRTAASQVKWAVASRIAGAVTSSVADVTARRGTPPVATRVMSTVATSTVASRVTTVALVIATLLAFTATANARPTGDRDDDVEEREDDERDDVDDRGGVALELEADANTGATSGATGGPGLRRAPAIADVLEAAYDAAGLNHDPTRSWARRARVAGLIPWVTVKTGWDQSWHDDEPGDVGRSRTFEVRATWRLDRLLFEGRELQMSSIDTARRRERRRLASRVIRAYFVWRKVAPRGGLAAEAATAELDALTDGWFSERAKSGR